MTQRSKCLLEIRDGIAMGTARHGAEPRLVEIGDRLLPQFAVQGMVGQPLGLLGDASSPEPLDRSGNSRVQISPPVLQNAPVGHLVRQRVFEGVFDIGKKGCLIEKLRAL
jgi:hypothetical protein